MTKKEAEEEKLLNNNLFVSIVVTKTVHCTKHVDNINKWIYSDKGLCHSTKRIINFFQKGFLKGFNIFENIQTCDFQVHLKLSILNLLRTSVRFNLH